MSEHWRSAWVPTHREPCTARRPHTLAAPRLASARRWTSPSPKSSACSGKAHDGSSLESAARSGCGGCANGAASTGMCCGIWRRRWLGILLPTDRGGLGLGMTEAALLLEQVGRALAPEPVGASMLAAAALAACEGNDPLLRRRRFGRRPGRARRRCGFGRRRGPCGSRHRKARRRWKAPAWEFPRRGGRRDSGPPRRVPTSPCSATSRRARAGSASKRGSLSTAHPSATSNSMAWAPSRWPRGRTGVSVARVAPRRSAFRAFGRAAGRDGCGARDDTRISRDARAVRPAARRVPGPAASRGRRLHAYRRHPVPTFPDRRGGGRYRPCHGGGVESARFGLGAEGDQIGNTDAWRYRLYRRARCRALPQARDDAGRLARQRPPPTARAMPRRCSDRSGFR